MSDEQAEDEITPHDEPSGVWTAKLQDADKVDVYFVSKEISSLSDCTVLNADRDAVLLRHKSGTVLVPRSSIAYIRLSDDQEFKEGRRERFRQIAQGGTTRRR